MTTSPTPLFISELESGEPLSEGTLAYFRERQRNRIHDLVLGEFLKSGISKAAFARRIGRKPEQITRWLAAPGNWELDTISDFLLAISGAELRPSLSYPAKQSVQDHSGPEWLSPTPHAIEIKRRGFLPVDGVLESEKTRGALEAAFSKAAPQLHLRSAALDIASKGFEPVNDNDPYIRRDPHIRLSEGAALAQVG